ncbi:MAG: histidinol-phosphatase, partial [Anaerolineae bacterium]|nr:histidinol-phosphatase [Anaerolineae bacterium]
PRRAATEGGHGGRPRRAATEGGHIGPPLQEGGRDVIDLHVHSTCSADGGSSIGEYARRAQELGLVEVGLSEHADFDPRDRSYRTLDLARYDQEMAAARAMAPEVRLRQGVEITYQANLEAEIRTWLTRKGWDYVIASVHLVDYADGWAMVSEPSAVEAYFEKHNQRQAYLPYFEELLRAARSGLGDILGHFDLVKRYGAAHYGRFEPASMAEEIRAVLRAAVEAGVGLEINTSGLRQAPGEAYPGLTVLRWYRELGGEILTVGSDAHRVEYLAAGADQALALARAAGFTAITTFEARAPRWIPIEDFATWRGLMRKEG